MCAVLCFPSHGWGSCVESLMGHGGPICNLSPQLCDAPSSGPSLRGCSPGSSVGANMETWLTTLTSEVVRGQGPPAGWSSSLTFNRRNPLLTPQLTSTSAPLLEEQRGRPPPPYLFILYLFPFIIFCLGTPRPWEIAILFH